MSKKQLDFSTNLVEKLFFRDFGQAICLLYASGNFALLILENGERKLPRVRESRGDRESAGERDPKGKESPGK